MATRGRMALATTACLLSLLVAGTALGRPRHVRRVRHHRRPAPVAASRSTNQGVYLSAGLVATDLTDDYDFPDVDSEGTGIRLTAGARVTDGFALELSWLGMGHEATSADEIDAFIQAGTLDFKGYITSPGTLELFAFGGLGVYGFSSNDTGERLVGPGIDFGAGVQLNLTSDFAVVGRAAYHLSAIDNSSEYAPATEDAKLAFVDGSVMMQIRF